MTRNQHPGRTAAVWLTITLLTFAHAAPTFAHAKRVHQDMADTAFKIMQKVADNPEIMIDNWPESSVNYEEVPLYPFSSMSAGSELAPPIPPMFRGFLEKIQASVPVIESLNATGLPAPGSPCGTLSPSFNGFSSLGSATYALSDGYGMEAGCGLRLYTHGDYYDDPATNNFAAITIGYLAAKPDNHPDDTHLFLRPVNMGDGLVGTAVDVVDAIVDGIGTVLVAPVVGILCLLDTLFGTGGCSSPIDLADAANPIDAIAEKVNIGDISNENWIGLWHHINVKPGLANTYDDSQGFLLEDAGWLNDLDSVEVATMIATDLAGLSVNHDDSQGIGKYQLSNVNDGLPPSVTRSKSEWQSRAVGHIAFNPLDNLAYHGWSRFQPLRAGVAVDLAWPLHALGDAVSPMHTISSHGWGHAPFEHHVEDVWGEVTFDSTNTLDHHTQVLRILRYAYIFRGRIEQWRLANPGSDTDLPIRALVTTLARDTFEYSSRRMNERKVAYDDCEARCNLLSAPENCGPCIDRPFPFHPNASAVFHFTEVVDPYFAPVSQGLIDPEANNIYEFDTEFVDLVRPMIEMGIGAKIAFLMTAAEAK